MSQNTLQSSVERPEPQRHAADAASLRQLFGCFATGVTVVTACDAEGRPRIDPGPLLRHGERLTTFFFNEINRARPQIHALLLRAMPPPESVIISAISATQQEGLFQQTVTFSNHETVALEGLRLYFPGLPSNWQLYNGSGTEEGVPFLEVAALIPPVSSIQFTVQFLISSETRPARQSYVVRRGSVHDAGTPPLPLMVEKAAPRVDGAFELRFTSELNGTYRIQYSRDLQDWQSVPQSVMATGGQTHWVDDGPPKTVSKPSAEHLRFYRILRLP